jgi:hypothetical protein
VRDVWADFDARPINWWAARDAERRQRDEAIEKGASALLWRLAGVKPNADQGETK